MPTNTIKGLNIAFGADTAEFNKGVKQVNSELAASQSLGKELNKALKFDPTSIKAIEKSLSQNEKSLELATKKAKIYEDRLNELADVNIDELTNNIEDTQKALKKSEEESASLKTELKELSAVDVDSENIKKLETALKESETASNELKESLADQNKILKQLDPANMDKLAAQSEKAKNQVSLLEEEQKKLNNDITALKTEKYDELSFQTKKAAVNTGDLTKEQVGFGKAVKATDLDSLNNDTKLSGALTNEFGGAIGNATKFLNPYTAAAAGASAAIGALVKVTTEAYKTTKEASKYYATMTFEMENTSISSSKLYSETARLSKLFGVEFSEGMEISKKSLNLYGNEVGSTISYQEAFVNTMLLSKNEVFGYEESLRTIRRAQYDWNASIEEGEALILASSRAVNTYGTSADDLLDTYNEFYDTFAKAGGSAENFFDILISGTILGARNTDEVANAINEVILRAEAMSDSTKKAYEQIGISSEYAQQAIKDDNIAGLLLDIIDGLSGVENATAAAAEIAGTYGEEFLEPLSKSEEKVSELHQAIDTLAIREESLNEINNVLANGLFPLINNLGLTKDQVKNLKTEYDGTSESVINYLAKNDLLDQSLTNLNGSLNLTSEQQAKLNQAYQSSIIPLIQNLAGNQALKKSMEELNQNKIISKEQQEELNNALTNGIIPTLNYLKSNGLLAVIFKFLSNELGINTEKQAELTAQYTAGLDPLTKFVSENKNLSTILSGLPEVLGLTAAETDNLKYAFEQGTETGKQFLLANGLMGKTLSYLSERLGFTKEQTDILNEAQKIYAEEGKAAAINYLVQTGALMKLSELGLGPSTEKVKEMEDAQTSLNEITTFASEKSIEFTNKLIENRKEMGLGIIETQQLKNQYGILSSETSTTTEKIAAFSKVIFTAGQEIGLSYDETKKLTSQFDVLANVTSTVAEKTTSFKTILDELRKFGIIETDRKLDEYKKTVDEMAKSTEKAKGQTGDISDDIVNLGKTTNISTEDINKYTKAWENTTTGFDKFASNIEGAKANLLNLNNDLANSTGYLNNFNASLAGANNNSSNFASPNVSSRSITIPNINTAIPTTYNRNSTTFSGDVVIKINGKSPDVDDLVKEAVPKLRYEIGRLINND